MQFTVRKPFCCKEAANFRVDTYLMNLLESLTAIVNFSTNGMKMYTELLIQIKTKNRSWIPN